MLFTAISYGRMANAYPSAGSAYTYVGRELHPALGYLTGWAMVFDYVLNPIISVIWCSDEPAMNFVPHLPFPAWAVFFAAALHAAEPAGHQGQRAHQRRAWPPAWGSWSVLFLAAAVAGRPGSVPDWRRAVSRALLRPADLLLAAVSTGTSHGHAHLHRLRRHLDALRGGPQSAPQHPAGHRADLPDYRHPGFGRGLCRPAGLAR